MCTAKLQRASHTEVTIPFGEFTVPATGPFHPHLDFAAKLHQISRHQIQSLQKFEGKSKLQYRTYPIRPGAQTANSHSREIVTLAGCVIHSITIKASTMTPSSKSPSLTYFRGRKPRSWLRCQLCLRHKNSYQKLCRNNLSRHTSFYKISQVFIKIWF